MSCWHWPQARLEPLFCRLLFAALREMQPLQAVYRWCLASSGCPAIDEKRKELRSEQGFSFVC